jgi:hypothetical protein
MTHPLWHSAVVPLFDIERLEGPAGAAMAEQYRVAEPFPHVVLPDFIDADAAAIVGAFPDQSWSGWADRSSRFQPGKSSCRDLSVMPSVLRELIYELSEPRFLRAVSSVIAIPNLLPDPFLEGGGLQWTGPGGKLLPHPDFPFCPTPTSISIRIFSSSAAPTSCSS